MSDHAIEVVRIKEVEPHPNADTLGIVRVHGWTCCVRLGDWKEGDLAAYIIPDSVVDSERPEFAFLKGNERIKVKRLRGVYSQGLLVPAPDGLQEGDDAAGALGVEHYDPELHLPNTLKAGSEAEAPPPGFIPKYDVENFRRYPDLFLPGEEVVVTEKIHGANARFCYTTSPGIERDHGPNFTVRFDESRFWAGSKTEWKRYDPHNLWWRALLQAPTLQEFLRQNPDFVAYGENYGSVQNLKYGVPPGEIRLVIIDLWHVKEGRFLDFVWAQAVFHDAIRYRQWAPVLYRGPFDAERIIALAEGPSTIPGADHLREGVVVRPVVERMDDRHGRVQLKIVSDRYLEKG